MISNKCLDELESLAANFKKMNEEYAFLKDRLVEFDQNDRININFKNCHVAISPNGGLIAICKKRGFLDITKGSKINDYIIVTHQNQRKKYYIPINWDYQNEWIVSLDFNEKEQLYALCNDGIIYKMDILTLKANKKVTNETLKKEGIEKAKFYGNGFVCLTGEGNFYYIKNIKNPVSDLLFSMRKFLNNSNNVDFILIPENRSKSKKLELLITNDTSNGLLRVVHQPSDNFTSGPVNVDNNDYIEIKGLEVLKVNKLERFLKSINDDQKVEDKDSAEQNNSLGKITALAISPSKTQIACFDTRGDIFLFHSTLDEDLEKYPRKRLMLNIDSEEFTDNEINEQKAVLYKFSEGFQLEFCGEDAISFSGQRFIFLINTIGKTLVYKVTDLGEFEAMQGFLFSKCISEVDGLRYITNEGVYLITRVPKELCQIGDPFSDSISRELIKSYQSSLENQIGSEKTIRDNGQNLSEAINCLLKAAANLFWIDDDKEGDKKNIQLFLLQAAQHGKFFVQRENFNFGKFMETCKEIRVVNNLRNHTVKPRFITYREFLKMDPKDLINKIIRTLNFGIAFEIARYLDYSDNNVYKRYAISCIKNLPMVCEDNQQKKLFEHLNEKLKNVENFSYINLAKKAFKYNKTILGNLFLENEKSVLTKIPQYVEIKEWDKAIDLSLEVNDSNIIMIVLDRILKVSSVDEFINRVSNKPKAKAAVIEFLRKNAPEQLENYLKTQKNIEEMFFFYLEKYFSTNSLEERRKFLSQAKEAEKQIDNANFDHKFYRNYLDSLEYSPTFKKECMEGDRNIIKEPEKTSYDLSIYDYFKLAVNAEKYNWIETQNKHFGISSQGLSLLRIISYGESEKIHAIDALTKKTSLKKLSLTPLNMSEIYFKFKSKEKVAEYVKQINDPVYFEYKIDMLKYMERYEDALEVIISDRNNDNIPQLVNQILSKKPNLKAKADQLCLKYKINLNK